MLKCFKKINKKDTGVFAAGGKEANEPAKADTAKELVYLNSHGNVWDGEIGEEIFKAFYDKFALDRLLILSTSTRNSLKSK